MCDMLIQINAGNDMSKHNKASVYITEEQVTALTKPYKELGIADTREYQKVVNVLIATTQQAIRMAKGK